MCSIYLKSTPGRRIFYFNKFLTLKNNYKNMIKNAKPILLAVLLIEAVLIGGQKVESRLLKNKINESIKDVQGISHSTNPYIYYTPPKPIVTPPKPYNYYVPKPPIATPYVYYNYPNNQTGDRKLQVKPLQEITSGINMNFAKRLSGRILLQAEQRGAMWYVDTREYRRHLLTRENAFQIFKKYAIGISNANLVKIPAVTNGIRADIDSDGDGYNDLEETVNNYSPYYPKPVKVKFDLQLARRLAGNFLMQVEQGGTIWYIDNSGRRHIIREDTLIDFLNRVALGISNNDLSKIPSE